MDTVDPLLPELDDLRRDPVADPALGPLDLILEGVPEPNKLDRRLEVPTVGHHLALVCGEIVPARAGRAALPVAVRLGRGYLGDRARDPDLTLDRPGEVEHHRGARVRGEVIAFVALTVGEEHEPAVEPAKQHHSNRWDPVSARRCERHRLAEGRLGTGQDAEPTGDLEEWVTGELGGIHRASLHGRRANPAPRAVTSSAIMVQLVEEVPMGRYEARRGVLALVAGLVLPIAFAAALTPFRTTFASTASALVLVAVVVGAAANGRRLAGYLAAASASLSFDFFLTVPYERLAISHPHDIETTVCLFVVGIAVTELAARNRYHRHIAVAESDYVGVVYYLAELVASGASADQVTRQATAELIDLLGLRSCRFDRTVVAGSPTRIEHDGNVTIGKLEWGAEESGLPGHEVELLVQSRGETLGRFVLEPTPGRAVSLQQRVVAVAVADQVGAALTPHLRSA